MKSVLSFVKKNINSSEQWDGVNYTKNKIQQGSWDESLGVGMPHVPNQDLSRFQMQANKLSKINESLRLPKSPIELRCQMIVLF